MTSSQTSASSDPRRILLRRGGAVIAGVVVVTILDITLDVIMHATGIYPTWFQPMATHLWLLATAYRMVDGMIGGYVAAWLAPDRPLAHAFALGIIGFVLSTLGAIATWNRGPEFGPKWYPVALVAISIPCACLGGLLRAQQSGRR